MHKITAALLGGATALVMFGAVAHADNPMVGGAAMYADKNIVENAVNSKDHTTLVAAVTAPGPGTTVTGRPAFRAPVRSRSSRR